MLGNWYQTFLKNKTLSKMVLIYSSIAIVIVVGITQVILSNITNSTVRSQLDIQGRALASIDDYMQETYDYMEQIVYDIYSQPTLADNLAYFLQHTYNEYIDYRLDQITKIGVTTIDVSDFFLRKMDANRAIMDIILYGDDSQQLYHFRKGRLQSYQLDSISSYVPGAIVQDTARLSVPNVWVGKLIDREQEGLYSIRADISQRYSYGTIGRMLVYFDSELISSAIAPYVDKLKGNLLVLTSKGQVIYDQSGQYYGDIYPYMEKITTRNNAAVLDDDSWINVVQNDSGIILASIVPNTEITADMENVRHTIFFFSVACILVIIIIPLGFAMNYTKRMHLIIRSMRSVETGEMSIRIPIKRNDELGLIAGSFNQMLSELTHHINRSYKAEMEQSKADMAALQARVNPHFLYNSLEVIRMKAVSLGVTEVGDMVYNLANLFRNIVKEDTVVLLKQEIENCRLYLELFKSRYQDNFTYEIQLDPHTAKRRIVKLSLQVIIENFIVHGLRDDDTINHIELTTEMKNDCVQIMIKDNGVGIEKEKLAHIQSTFTRSNTDSEAFGLRSVYKRLVYLYGDACSMTIESLPREGTTVMIILPYTKGEE